MQARNPDNRSADSRSARRWLPGGVALVFLALAQSAATLQPDEAAGLLQKADNIKTSDPAAFTALLESLEQQSQSLAPPQLEFLHYLRGWKSAYDGDNEIAIARLKETIAQTHDVTLKFRANASVINVLVLGSHYEDAFTQLPQLLALLPQVTDPAAREQGLVAVSQLYDEVGQYDLGIKYSQKLIDENWRGRGICKGWEEKLRAQVLSGKVQSIGPDFAMAIDACTQHSELGYANFIRTFMARVYIAHDRLDDAIRMLTEHYAEAQRTHYRRLLSDYESLLAESYLKKGNIAKARQFALSTIETAVPNQYTEPVVVAYRLLYELARNDRDFKAALEYHEKFAAADKGYLDIESARQLAYQRVAHESAASHVQIAALNKENHVLQLERALAAKAVENSRLYIMLLLMAIAFVALWAYRTKRLQLHFMSLSQVDGLTGISNRPHFIKQALYALESASRAGQPICIILCDLDHFKSINDKFGHAAGDLVLKRAVADCAVYMRSHDLFGRFGGEEFSILLSGCALEDARLRAEHLRLTISGIAANGNSGSSVTASFGIACSGSSGYDLRQLLAHADSALYAAKRAGRNRVVCYDTSLTEIGTGSTGSHTTLPTTDPEPASESDMSDARILGVAGTR